MIQYIVHRLLLALPTLLGITVISFLIMHLAPGDPVDLYLGGAAEGEGIDADGRTGLEQTRQELRRQLGLDQALHIQYLNWLSRLLLRVERLDSYESAAAQVDAVMDKLSPAQRRELEQMPVADRKDAFADILHRLDPQLARRIQASVFWTGRTLDTAGNYRYAGAGLQLYHTADWRLVTLNFGRSFKDQQPVIGHILERLPITLQINLISLVVAYIIGIPVGIVAATRQDTLVDRSLTTGTFMLWSMPSFWVGMLFIIFLCNREFLHWFPAAGIQSLGASEDWGYWQLLRDRAHHMVLPVVTSSYSSFAAISRYMRTSMLENLRLDYVRTAYAKGLPGRVVVLRHVLRNSLIPIVTLMGWLLPGMIAGSVFVETIFTIPGMGFLAFQSVIVRDYPMAMAIFTIGAVLSLAGILVADILLKAVDPRIEFSRIQG